MFEWIHSYSNLIDSYWVQALVLMGIKMATKRKTSSATVLLVRINGLILKEDSSESSLYPRGAPWPVSDGRRVEGWLHCPSCVDVNRLWWDHRAAGLTGRIWGQHLLSQDTGRWCHDARGDPVKQEDAIHSQVKSPTLQRQPLPSAQSVLPTARTPVATPAVVQLIWEETRKGAGSFPAGWGYWEELFKGVFDGKMFVFFLGMSWIFNYYRV